jgi:hypothetical protein
MLLAAINRILSPPRDERQGDGLEIDDFIAKRLVGNFQLMLLGKPF